MKFNKNWLDKRWVAYTVATCSAVVLFVILINLPGIFEGLSRLVDYFKPIILGGIIAYVMNPIMGFFERSVFYKMKNQTIRRGLSLVVAVLIVLAIIIFILVSIVPQIISNTAGFFNNFDSYANSLQKLVDSLAKNAAAVNMDISEFTNVSDTVIRYLTTSIPKNITNIISASMNVGKGVFNFVIALILAVYFLLGKERVRLGVKHFMRAFFSPRAYVETVGFLKTCNGILISYIIGDLFDALLVGAANFVFMTVTGMNYKILISVIVGITNLAPTFGPIAGAIVGGLILLFANPWHAVLFLIFTIILQTIDGYVLKPKLFGNTLGISSLWILIVLIVSGRMFGIIGILIAIPLAAILDFIYKDVVIRRIDSKWAKKKREEVIKRNEDI